MEYNRDLAIAYAHKWAFHRNPGYYNFDGLGGDCTNFISQCIYAGCQVMNYTRDTGWYYISPSRRSAGWSGVSYLYNFLTRNEAAGPYGHEINLSVAAPGDIIQLSFDNNSYSHSLIIVETGKIPTPENVLIATHTYDSDNRPLSTYLYASMRVIAINGVRN